MDVLCYDGKNVPWEVEDNSIVQNPKENDEIGLQGFGFIFSMNMRGEGKTWIGRLSLFFNVD